MQDRPETDSGHGAWLAKSLSLSLSFLRSGFFVCTKETNRTMTERGWRTPTSHYGSLSLFRE